MIVKNHQKSMRTKIQEDDIFALKNDFSFKKPQNNSNVKIIGTSHESYETLINVYPGIK